MFKRSQTIYVTDAGQECILEEMSTTHILNTIKHLDTRTEILERKLAENEPLLRALTRPANEAIEMFLDELDRRFNEGELWDDHDQTS